MEQRYFMVVINNLKLKRGLGFWLFSLGSGRKGVRCWTEPKPMAALLKNLSFKDKKELWLVFAAKIAGTGNYEGVACCSRPREEA
ncbi:MAG: hypothetical protein GX335_07825 [Firmicutes bacterium]|nr:hypothetical protein [Bacillota bacterium]